VIVLGPKRLPEAGRALGSAIRGFTDSLSAPERRSGQSAIQSSRKPEQTLGAWPDRRGGGCCCPALYQASIALLRLNERRSARHEQLSG
jgi:Sec-independent protein translocase protein TatA